MQILNDDRSHYYMAHTRKKFISTRFGDFVYAYCKKQENNDNEEEEEEEEQP
jgi:hypothetical protein